MLKTHETYNGEISSLDLENLFTNVPVPKKKNDIIIDNIYQHRTIPSLEVPFFDPHENRYNQKDGNVDLF